MVNVEIYLHTVFLFRNDRQTDKRFWESTPETQYFPRDVFLGFYVGI